MKRSCTPKLKKENIKIDLKNKTQLYLNDSTPYNFNRSYKFLDRAIFQPSIIKRELSESCIKRKELLSRNNDNSQSLSNELFNKLKTYRVADGTLSIDQSLDSINFKSIASPSRKIPNSSLKINKSVSYNDSRVKFHTNKSQSHRHSVFNDIKGIKGSNELQL